MIRRLFKTKRRGALVVLLLGYTLLMLFGGCANKLILFPSRQPIDARTAHRVLVGNSPGRNLETWVDRSPGAARAEPMAYVIEFTGNATRAEQVASYAAARWENRPIESWMVNYPGYGGSDGAAELSAIAPAALAVYDHVDK